MSFETRIRDAIQERSETFHVDPELFAKVESRIYPQRRNTYRKWIIGTGLSSVLLVGANSVVFAASGKSLLDVIVHTNTISEGSGMMSDWAFIPVGGKSPTADQPPAQNAGLPTTTSNTGTSAPKLAPVQIQKLGTSADGKSFTGNHYDRSLSEFLNTNLFPKMNSDDVQVQFVDAAFRDKATQQFNLNVTGIARVGTLPKQVELVLYHNEAGSFQIDGDTIAPGNSKSEVKLNGQDATYIRFSNANASQQRYLTWSRGPWVILLTGGAPEETFMQIAQSVDQQAQVDQ